MNQRTVSFILAGIIVLLLVVGGFYIMNNKKASEPTKTSQVNQDPCADTINLIADLKAKEEAVQNAEIELRQLIDERNIAKQKLSAAIKKCRPHLSNGDTLHFEIIKPERKSPAPSKQTGKSAPPTNTSSKSESDGQNVSSRYSAPAQHSVNTSVTGGNTPKALLCFNVRDMDGSSFWPALAIDAGTKIEGAVINGTGDGWNISIYPVEQVSGLYGVTLSGRMFVKAELLDQFNPTVIKASGSPNGWKTWVEMELETINGEDYYITPAQ